MKLWLKSNVSVYENSFKKIESKVVVDVQKFPCQMREK